jgi:hypothetical protein
MQRLNVSETSMSQRHKRHCIGLHQFSTSIQHLATSNLRLAASVGLRVCVNLRQSSAVTQRQCDLPAPIQLQLQLSLCRQCAALRRCCVAQDRSGINKTRTKDKLHTRYTLRSPLHIGSNPAHPLGMYRACEHGR